MRPVSYLLWVAATAVSLAVITLSLTVVVDPYYTFGTPRIRGWTELKPRVYEHAWLAKTSQLERYDPQTLILGNSRAEIGFDPTSPAWPEACRPVFNAALAGGSIYSSLLLLEAAIAHHRPATIVLGIDFQDFLTERKVPTEPDENKARRLLHRDGTADPWRSYQHWKDGLASTLTIDAVTDSVMTLIDQDPMNSATMTPLGFNPLHEYRVFANRNGYRALFAAKAVEYRKQYAAYERPDFQALQRSPAYQHLAALLNLARAHNIRVLLYFYPYHAEYLEMLHDMGFWPSFEAWKRAVVYLTRDSQTDAPLFDFAEYNALTTEAVPAPNDRRSAMKWYWEPGHYKSTLGHLMLAVMFNMASSSIVQAPLGHVLTAENIDSVLAEIDQQRLRFVGDQQSTLRQMRSGSSVELFTPHPDPHAQASNPVQHQPSAPDP